VIAIIFGLVLLYSAYISYRPPTQELHAEKTGVCSPPPDGQLPIPHRRLQGISRAGSALGFGIMYIAGCSPASWNRLRRRESARDGPRHASPFKVSTTTSNFMIGVTAAASAGVYLNRGYIDPGLAMPVMLGVLAGSLAAPSFSQEQESLAANGVQFRNRGPRRRDDRERFQREVLALSVPDSAMPNRQGETCARKTSAWKKSSARFCGQASSRGRGRFSRRSVLPRALWFAPAHYGIFRGEPGDLSHVLAILRDAIALHRAGSSSWVSCSSSPHPWPA